MIQKFFISFLFAVFGLFLSSPIFAVGNTGTNITILSARYSDICSTTITCEKSPEGVYNCSETPETITTQGSTVHQLSSGKGNLILHIYPSYTKYIVGDYYKSSGIVCAQEENYVYPFVRIIKIQV